MAKRKILKIQMLGGFHLEYGGKSVIPKSNSRNKVLYLLEYIIANRHRTVPQNELIDVLLGDDDGVDPGHTLKNLIYRSRKIFSDAGLDEKEYIYFHGGAYGFSQKAPCTVDIEEFEKQVNIAQNSSDIETQLKAGMEAINIYKGEFLPFSYQQIWVLPTMVKYQNMYFAIINMISDILLERQDYETVLTITEKASAIYPYNEDFYIRRISALQKMGRARIAIREYDAVSAMLFDELGVTPSEELQDLYMKATEEINDLPLTLDQALGDIMEEEHSSAFYCNYHMFSNVCRYMMRYSQRNGQSGFLVMCSIVRKDSEPIVSEHIKDLALAFHRSISESLRQSDTYTRCRSCQFLVLLMGANQENSRMVMKRVENTFKHNCRKKNYVLKFQYSSHADISKYLEKSDITWEAKKLKTKN